MEFAIGDVVRLKSGSDDLTVVEKHDDGKYVCSCWLADGWRNGVFPTEALVLAPNTPKAQPSVMELDKGYEFEQ